MAFYLLDSSAVVKRYLAEVGSAWVTSLVASASARTLFVVQLTGVEVVAAISRRQRGGSVSPADAARALAEFRRDLGTRFRVVGITPGLIASAMNLAEAHPLTGYDAVQLATARKVKMRADSFSLPFTFVSADAALLAAAAREGLAVDNPDAHP